MLDQLFGDNIGRIVAFVLTPILLPVTAAVAKWGQDVLGVNLSGDQLTAYIVSVTVGIAAVIYKWLSNRGAWEVAVNTVTTLHDDGNDLVNAPAVQKK